MDKRALRVFIEDIVSRVKAFSVERSSSINQSVLFFQLSAWAIFPKEVARPLQLYIEAEVGYWAVVPLRQSTRPPGSSSCLVVSIIMDWDAKDWKWSCKAEFLSSWLVK